MADGVEASRDVEKAKTEYFLCSSGIDNNAMIINI